MPGVEDMDISSVQATVEFPGAPDWAQAILGMVSNIDTRLERLEAKVEVSQARSKTAKAIASETREHVEELEARIDQLEYELQRQEDFNRRYNLKIEGLQETAQFESSNMLHQTIQKFFSDDLKINSEIRLERWHRLGQKGTKPRPVIIRFTFFQDRELVWSRKTNLKGKMLVLREDFSAKTDKARKILYPYAKAAKDANARYSLRADVLFIEGTKYTTANMKDIPVKYHPANNSTKQNDDAVLFFGRNSVFSNFYPSKFKYEGHMYTTNEMYYQAKKADHFGDDKTAARIRSSQDPYDCWRAGSKVKAFDPNEWEKVEEQYMYHGVVAKFSQNPDLLNELCGTEDKVIAESCTDETWGTGLRLHNKNAFDRSLWTGQNKLGKCLMKARGELRN